MFIPEIRKLQELLVSFLGEPKNGITEDGLQMQFPCPRCIEEKGPQEGNKYNLEITLGKDLYKRGGLFHCWSCCSNDDVMRGGVFKLIKLYGNADILRSYKRIIDDMRTTGLYKLPEYRNAFGDDVDIKEVKLPPHFTPIDCIETCPEQVKKYLEERHFTNNMIRKFGIGYTLYDKDFASFSNRIIVPSYSIAGDLEFWSGRDFTGNPKRPKYYNTPDADKNSIVFQGSHIEWCADILLVEGALDTVFGPPNTIGLLGKVLNKNMEVYDVLQEKAKANVIIGLDADTTLQEIKNIYSVLDRGRLKGRVRYIRMDKYKDIADAFRYGGTEGVIDCLQEQKTFTELELLF